MHSIVWKAPEELQRKKDECNYYYYFLVFIEKYVTHFAGKRIQPSCLTEKENGTLFTEKNSDDVAWALVLARNSQAMWSSEYERENKNLEVEN